MKEKKEKILIAKVNPVIDAEIRELCKRAYPNHPKGCPNYNIKDTCPPKTKMFYEVFDIDYPIYAIINAFDLKSHVEKMRTRHPMWSEKQLVSSRFWQGKARKELKGETNKFLKEYQDYTVTSCPEGLGVNVTETLKNAGITLEWPPRDVVYQVALAGKKITKQNELS